MPHVNGWESRYVKSADCTWNIWWWMGVLKTNFFTICFLYTKEWFPKECIEDLLNCKMVHRTSVWTFFEVLWGNKTSKTLNPKLCWWEIFNFFYKYTFRCCYALEDLHLFLGGISWPFPLESNISSKVCSKHWFWKISRLVFWDHLY
jgi:hypothetical protein